MDVITKEQWQAAADSISDENYLQEDLNEKMEYTQSIYDNFSDSEIVKNTVNAFVQLGNAMNRDMSTKIFGLGVDFGMRLQKLRTKTADAVVKTKPLHKKLDA